MPRTASHSDGIWLTERAECDSPATVACRIIRFTMAPPLFIDAHAAITFARPAILAGLVVAALPVAIHFLTQARSRIVVLPTTRFLRAGACAETRFRRMRHLVAMLLRCACLAAVVFAFARPEWSSSVRGAADADGACVSVIILDVSASMDSAESSVSTLARGVARTAAVLDGLRPGRGDSANVILAGAVPHPLRNEPTNAIAALRRDLRSVDGTAERADVNAAFAATAAQLALRSAQRRQVHIVSDLQCSNWRDAALATLPTDTSVFVHRLAGDLRPNAAITDLLLDPLRPVAGQICRVTVHLANWAPISQSRDVTLRAGDGREWRRPHVSIEANAQTAVQFDMSFATPGFYNLTASINPDATQLDDRRFAVARVSAQMPIVLCTDADLTAGVTSAYLLSRAIEPYGPRRGAIDLRVLRSAELSVATIADAQVVFLDAVDSLASSTRRALRDFLMSGGGVVVFISPSTNAASLAAMDELSPTRGTLPLRFGAPRSMGAGPPTHIEPVRPDSAFLRPLDDVGLASLGFVNVYRHLAAWPVREDLQAILLHSNGDVAAALSTVGSGTLLLCNIPVDPAWSDLAKHAVFPGLVHQFIDAVRPRQVSASSAFAGAAPILRWSDRDTDNSLRVQGPDGRPVACAIHRDGAFAVAALPPCRTPGHYLARSGGRLLDSTAVNVDPRESDLASLSLDEFGTPAGQSRSHVLAGVATTAARGGMPLWPSAFMAALALLAMEMLCLLRWGSAHGGN